MKPTEKLSVGSTVEYKGNKHTVEYIGRYHDCNSYVVKLSGISGLIPIPNVRKVKGV